jgi:hypothetical protein
VNIRIGTTNGALRLMSGMCLGIVAALDPAQLFAQAGSVGGIIVTSARALPPIRVTIDQKVCGPELPDETIAVGPSGGLANVVVTIRGVAPAGPQPDPMVVNEKCRFVPRVQVVGPKASVKTTSRDPTLHTTTVQTPAGQQLFNVALPQPGITITRPVGGPGIYRVGCSIHQWMRAWIVSTTDRAVVTGADGRFTMAGIAPGTYQLEFWHEALEAAPRRVTVAAGKQTDLRVEMK